ncbi:hypothetical protein FXO37_32887 [Capsicum annuum]|nr:hypothetical protein FXO37_32887 [Capsicum annuum]
MGQRKVSAVAGLVQGRNHPERIYTVIIVGLKQAGILLGRSGLGRFCEYSSLIFRTEGRLILQTIADIGFMFHSFVLGVQVDPTMLRRAGRTAMLIGASSFAVPVALGGLGSYVLPHLTVIDDTTAHVLQITAVVNSASYLSLAFLATLRF